MAARKGLEQANWPSGSVNDSASRQDRVADLLTRRKELQKLDTDKSLGLKDKLDELSRLQSDTDMNILLRSQEINRILDEVETIIWSAKKQQGALKDDVDNNTKKKTTRQTQQASDKDETEFFMDKYLDENDIPFLSGIKWRLEKTEKMTLAEILKAAKDVKLKGKIEWKESWDSFFKDLRNEVSNKDLAEFDSEVSSFKIDFKNIYNSNIDTTIAGNSIDQNLLKIEAGEFDKAFQKWVKFDIDIKAFAEVLWVDTSFGDIKIGPFTSKEEAVKSLYKIKLILKELEHNGKGLLKRYYSTVLSGWAMGIEWTLAQGWDIIGDISDLDFHHIPVNIIHWAGLLILTSVLTVIWLALPIGAVLVAWAIPLESLNRRVQDYLSKQVGDKWWGANLRKWSEWLKKWSNFFWTQALAGAKWLGKWSGENKRGPLKRLWNLARLAWAWTAWSVTKPADLILWSSSSLLSAAERQTLDPSNLLNANTLLVDGLPNQLNWDWGSGNEHSNKVAEIRSRAKILALLERIAEYEWDTDSLDRLEKVRAGSFNSNSESFYIDTNNIIERAYEDNSRKWVFKRYSKKAGEVFLILNKKEKVINEYTRYMENMNQMLSTIYKKVEFNKETRQITLPEKPEYTDFFKHMMADLDLWLISDTDETQRQKLLTELIDEIKKYKVGFLSQNELKSEIQKIVEGKMPKFKVIQSIVEKRKTLTWNTTALDNLEILRKMVLEDKWYGTAEQLDTVLNDITHTIPVDEKPTLRSLDDIQKEGDKLHKLSVKWNTEEFSKLTNIWNFTADIHIAEMLIDAWELRGNPDNIQRELSSFLTKARNGKLNLDWSTPEFNFIISKILSWEKYSNRWNGTFWDIVDVNSLIRDYNDFESRVRDINISKLLSKIETSNINTRITILLKITGNSDILAQFKNKTKYQNILNTTESEIKTKNDTSKKKLDIQKNKIDALLSWIDIDPKKGEGKIIDADFRSITSDIANLNREYLALDDYKTPFKSKVDFYNNALTKINSIESNITKLEASINRIKSIEAKSIAEAEAKIDAKKKKEVDSEKMKSNYDLVERAELQLWKELSDLRDLALDGTLSREQIVERLDKTHGIKSVKTRAEIVSDRLHSYGWENKATIAEIGDIKERINSGAGIKDFDEFKWRWWYWSLRSAIKKGKI